MRGLIIFLTKLVNYFKKQKKVEAKRPTIKLNVPKEKKKRKRYVKDKWGNRRQVVEVKTPRKIAKRITILAAELKQRKEAS